MRILPLKEACGALQMALDEAILEARIRGIVEDTLRFYTWKPSCVSIGYFQSAEREVDLGKARAMGVDVVRRYTGGGAVFHDKELTYSLVISEQRVPKNIIASYELICSFIIQGFRRLGLKASFAPINDILVNGKKVSGNAQTRRQGVVLQHGTILIDANMEKMFSLLKVSDEKLRGKMIQAAKERVTTLNKELGRRVSVLEVAAAMRSGFSLGKLRDGMLTRFEIEEAERLKQEKYGTTGWTLWR